MSAGDYNIIIEQGATYNPVLTWLDSTNTAVDLTGATARMQIRRNTKSTTVLEEITTENGGITLGGVAGTISLLISDTATAAYTWKTGVYDLEIISSGGVVTRLMRGTVEVIPEVTR